MRTAISLVIEHSKHIPNLAKLIEQRAYTIDGVLDANVQPTDALYASPLFVMAIDALNKTKAWRDSEGNEGFPGGVREQIDAVLMAYECRRSQVRADSHPASDHP